MARPKAAVVVTKVARQELDSMAHRARTAPQLVRRARIVLACATGLDNTTVAKKLRMSKPTVGRWRQRFIDKGGDGRLDEPRPGAPRTINDTPVSVERLKNPGDQGHERFEAIAVGYQNDNGDRERLEVLLEFNVLVGGEERVEFGGGLS